MMKNEKGVPLTVSLNKKREYLKNYYGATKDSGRLFLFAGDQKIEHLNKDFYGKNIPEECANPEHLFYIADRSRVGVFAVQLGLIAHYGADFSNINYIVKLNSKTNLISTKQKDPISLLLNNVEDVVQFQKRSKLNIVGVGYTVYLGSEFEAQMLNQASRIIYDAHQNGLLAVLWMYPRGKAIKNEFSADIIAGATGVAACLGADFVKVNPPKGKTLLERVRLLKQATLAAGKTKVICTGGKKKNKKDFLLELYNQIHIGGARGCALGRNIHQRSKKEAIAFCDAISSILFDDVNVEKSEKFLKES